MSSTLEQRDKDFSKLYHQVVDSGLLKKLSNIEIRVYLVLLRFSNYKTGLCYPTVKKITELSGVNKNNISHATEGLATKGLIEKVRTGKRFSFRLCYRVTKSRARLSQLASCIVPCKTDKCRAIKRGKNGRFKPIPRNTDKGIPCNTDDPIPSNSESCICPTHTDKKENLEINNRNKSIEKAGSASARLKRQASPALNSKKSLKHISKETLSGFIKEKGLEWVKAFLRKNGYDEKEIENLSGIEGVEGNGANTSETDKT